MSITKATNENPQDNFDLAQICTEGMLLQCDVPTILKELIESRRKVGIERYGQALPIHSGRDALADALAEAVDLNQYLMQEVLRLRSCYDELAAAIGVPEHMAINHENVMKYVETCVIE